MNVLQESTRQELAGKLNDLIETTEAVYTHIAEEYPKMLQEFDSGFTDADRQISLIAAEGGNGLDALHMIMDNTKGCIQQTHSSFSSLSSSDNSLLDMLKQSIKRLDTLEELIAAITFNTEEMELISLNAMVVALKAGQEGGGFSHVTDELRRISAKTISEAKNLTTEGKQIQSYFEEVQRTADMITQEQDRIFYSFGDKLFSYFSTIEERLTRIVNFFKTLRTRADDIRQPLIRMMEAVQTQDIIRQTVDQISITLDKIQSIDDSHNGNGREDWLLDELTFLEQVANLGSYLLENIAAAITENSETFVSSIEEVKKAVETIEHERDIFISRQIEGESRDDGIYDLFHQSENELGAMLKNTRKVPKLKQNMRTTNSAFLGRIQGLEEGFQKFTTLVGRFRNIHVAARIEVAKRQILKGMQSTVQEMRNLTDRIFSDVESALETTKEFIETAQEAEEGFRDSYRQETDLVSSFTLEIQRLYGKLKDTNDEIVRTMQGFTLFNLKFRELFGSTDADRERLAGLSQQARSIMEIFERTAHSAAARKAQILNERGLEKWEIREQRLQEIVNQFTIYAHKARAGEIGGFSVETGTQEGAVTFF
ncbi:methyl-accepting chemotaxis protein [Marispirochaeta aestuarii]|uniref:methyl-accepting chemotaxis protein n=1 Tax=Marispirochaeta aestuarii TaxID=1963862 RepID=UPI0029C8466F|nr:methyl-accepting chemotaxis protein [Marispirochaeta aestuarii]